MPVEARSASSSSLRRKLVVVGDGGCGKTSLLTVYTTDTFPTEHIPTVFETRMCDVQVAKQKVELALWDTAGQEEYDRLRPLSYPRTDVILICFSIDRHASYENVQERWVPEITHFCREVPVILVALKKDLRETEATVMTDSMKQRPPVSYKEGKYLAEKIKAQAFCECSAKTREGVDDIFITAARFAMNKGKAKRTHKICKVL